MDQDATGLRRAGAHAFLFNALTLVVNLATGIIVARALGSEGRGELTAILTLVVVGVWIFSLGCTATASFYVARYPQDAARFVGTWLVLLLPISVVGIALLELALPTVLGAQSSGTQALARLYVLTLGVSLLYQLAYGVQLGAHDFFFVYLVSFLRHGAIAAVYISLILFDALSVKTAVAITVAVDACICASMLQRALRRHGVSRPSSALARRTAWFGFRALGTDLGGIVNGRLDLFIMPAFLGATSVGLYSVATNVSWVVFTLASALTTLVLPAAARRERGGATIVVISLYVTLVVGIAMAGAIALVADVAVKLIYGSDFAGSATPLRLLLPGTVAFAAASVLVAGLNSLERPGSAAAAQAPGILITVVGLLLFLNEGGIAAAAIVSTISYTTVLVAALVLYRGAARVSWGAFLLRPDELKTYGRWLAAGAAKRIPIARRQEL